MKLTEQERNEGYYRVKLNGQWLIAKWHADDWYIPAREEMYSDIEFDEIDLNQIDPDPTILTRPEQGGVNLDQCRIFLNKFDLSEMDKDTILNWFASPIIPEQGGEEEESISNQILAEQIAQEYGLVYLNDVINDGTVTAKDIFDCLHKYAQLRTKSLRSELAEAKREIASCGKEIVELRLAAQSRKELSDEEIENEAQSIYSHDLVFNLKDKWAAFRLGAKWARTKLTGK